VFGGLNRPLAGAVIAGAFFAALTLPSTALACSGGVSAENVYKECLPTGGGETPVGSSASTGSTGSGTTPVQISKQAAAALQRAGKDKAALGYLVATGPARHLQSVSPAASEPSAIGSAFDLGSGPTALLIVLAGTAILLLAASGLRLRQRRH